MTKRTLLVELLVEELPPKALRKLGEAFSAGIAAGLDKANLLGASVTTKLQCIATPRRLAVVVPNVLDKAGDQSDTRKLVPLSVGYDRDGKRTPALIKKLASLGLEPDAPVYPMPDGKAEALFVDLHVSGATLAEGLQMALDDTLAKLPIPKLMSYQLADGWSSVKFVRPAHGLVALHGDELVAVQALGLRAGRDTQGHRFEATVTPLALRDADSYVQQLRDDGAVIASFDERRALIKQQLQDAAAALGLKPLDDAELLDEVTGLVERPNVLACAFDAEFLEVPPECLVLTMKANQKYFPLLDGTGTLTNRFLVVSNVQPADAGRIVEGNQRVVRPRLADAKFFYDQDRKRTLESRVPALDKVVYHGKLGSQGERVVRVRCIARAIGERLGGAALAGRAERAALLAKADLLTGMVGEFPELQGTMGGYYARHDGEPDDVALAIAEHYKPRFAGDALPQQDCGVVLALADKLETLVGLFGIGALPSGDKDPFALRRHAIGVIRMLGERQLPLPLDELLQLAFAAFAPGQLADARDELWTFMLERFHALLREQGFSAQQVEAVLAERPTAIDRVPQRIAAVRSFAALPEAAALAAANKRIANILKKSPVSSGRGVDAARFVEAAEGRLHQALQQMQAQADELYAQGEYTASLQLLAQLKEPVDAFFEQVMVNAEDPLLRDNRLALLQALHRVMNRVADLSRLAN